MDALVQKVRKASSGVEAARKRLAAARAEMNAVIREQTEPARETQAETALSLAKNGTVTVVALTDELGCSRSSAANLLSRMKLRGKLRKVDGGYSLP
jgi:hypothetical protein